MSGAVPFTPSKPAAERPPGTRDTARSDIARAVESATSGSHTPFGTLVAIAGAESSFRPEVKNRHSTAAGPYQITETTWLHLVKTYGASIGRADLASLVHENPGGKLTVVAGDRSQVLSARHDVDLSSQLAAKYCDECRSGLTKKLGRTPSEEEVRVAYFLGVSGATRLINAAADQPGTPMSALLPRAFANHRAMFSAQGRSLDAQQALNLLQTRYAAQIARGDALRSYASASDLAPSAPVADAAVAIAGAVRGQPVLAAGETRGVEIAVLPPMPVPPPAEPLASEPPTQVAAADEPKELACKTDTRGGVSCAL